MTRPILVLAVLLLGPATAAYAQSGTTQSRDGLGTGAHPTEPTNSMPAGTENATSGPQAHPAYPSGSDTPNPGAAFVRDQPKPASGQLSGSPGALATTRVAPGGGTTTRSGGPVGREGAAPLPPR